MCGVSSGELIVIASLLSQRNASAPPWKTQSVTGEVEGSCAEHSLGRHFGSPVNRARLDYYTGGWPRHCYPHITRRLCAVRVDSIHCCYSAFWHQIRTPHPPSDSAHFFGYAVFHALRDYPVFPYRRTSVFPGTAIEHMDHRLCALLPILPHICDESPGPKVTLISQWDLSGYCHICNLRTRCH